MKRAYIITGICSICIMLMSMSALTQQVTLLKNINPYNGSTSSPPFHSRDVAGGVMYFSMEDGGGITLWRTDGTTAGTYQYANATVVEDIRAIDGLVYFKGADAASGDEPWRSNGTSQGTFMLKDVARKSSGVYSHLDFVKFSGNVYFKAAWLPPNAWPDLSRSERYLLETDGTASGTATVTSLPQDNDLCVAGGGIFIQAIDMWLSDGTRKGTYELTDICSIFPAQYASCGTLPYPGLPDPYRWAHSAPVVVNGVYYAVYGDDQHGYELWRSDGTTQGTYMMYDLNPGAGGSYPSMITVYGNDIYCGAYAPSTGTELWRFPLTGGTPQLVKDINPGSGHSEPLWITEMNGSLYFSAFHPDYGRELWKSDGTPAGTVLVRDINPGVASANPRYEKAGWQTDERYMRRLCVMDNLLYFPADDGNGYEPWVSDGTLTGTTLLADVNPAAGLGSDPRYLTPVNGRLVFMAYEPVYGWEWRVYGTGANQPPVAAASASPTSGDAPLSVQFSAAGSYDPDGSITAWQWDFGDNSSSTLENPSHTYQNAGSYTAWLTVTDNNSATGTDQVTITVHVVSSGYVYVADQTVSRISMPGNRVAARNVILIKNDTGQPEVGAVVTVSYSGPTSGSVSGTTDANGEAVVESDWTRNSSASWCFTVTDVQSSGKSYNSGANIVTTRCETTPKSAGDAAYIDDVRLAQNYPNPFNPSTVIQYSLGTGRHCTLTVYDALGETIDMIVNGYVPAGAHAVSFDRKDLPSGLYWYRLVAGNTVLTRSMLILE